MTDSFREDFLANIAKSFGLSAEDLAADHVPRYSQAAAYERHIQSMERVLRQAKAATRYADTIYDQFVIQAMFRAMIQLPLADEIRYITGYHPQRLLPAPSKPIDVWGGMTEVFSSFVSNGFIDKFFSNDISREFIDFETVPKLTRYQIEGGHFDMWDREPRRLAPFVSPTGRAEKPKFITPTGRIFYPHIKPTEAMEEGRKFHMAVITGADYASIERQILASMYAPSVRCLVLDLDSPGGEIPRNPQQELYARGSFDDMLADARNRSRRFYENKPIFEDEDLVVDTAAGKRDKSYLKHDPSKSHKRRKRK